MPPKAMSALMRPQRSVSIVLSSSSTNAATLSRLTDTQRPSSQRARATTRPAGVSRRTMVSGSRIGTRPVSSRAVTTHMQLLPDMACARSDCSTMKPASASGRVGAISRLTDIWAQARGSCVTNRRRLPSTVLMWFILSSMVAPGISGAPPTITLPISPWQWTWTSSSERGQVTDSWAIASRAGGGDRACEFALLRIAER